MEPEGYALVYTSYFLPFLCFYVNISFDKNHQRALCCGQLLGATLMYD